MRKIETQEQKERKSRRNQFIVGMVMVVLMIFGTAGYAFMSNDAKQQSTTRSVYNGITFFRVGDIYRFSYNGQDFTTLNIANDSVEIISDNNIKITDYKDKPVYFVTESGEPNMEIVQNIYSNIQRYLSACLSEKECNGKNLPIKNCSEDNIIIIRTPLNGEQERIYQDRKCVFIIANYSNQNKYCDEFIFEIYGIKNTQKISIMQ